MNTSIDNAIKLLKKTPLKLTNQRLELLRILFENGDSHHTAEDVFKKVERAINPFNLIISLSARRRDINKKHITLKEFKKIIKRRNLNLGLMFGPESSGLSNKDLSFSNYILQIPTSTKFKSLNLSHSLTIICYEIFKLLNEKKIKNKGLDLKVSSKSKISSLLAHLISLLENKDFFVPKEKRQSMGKRALQTIEKNKGSTYQLVELLKSRILDSSI